MDLACKGCHKRVNKRAKSRCVPPLDQSFQSESYSTVEWARLFGAAYLSHTQVSLKGGAPSLPPAWPGHEAGEQSGAQGRWVEGEGARFFHGDLTPTHLIITVPYVWSGHSLAFIFSIV